jgi:hypothetical protein
MRKPDFFLIGAPKCGTSALATYLGEHPQIFFSLPKEPFYWCDDYPALRREMNVATIDDYLSLFAGARPCHLAVGEGSTRYLASSCAVEHILDFNPAARFIAMLRNPVEMVHACHGEAVFRFDEDVLDFETAWRLQERRKHGESLPRRCQCPQHLQYADTASFADQIGRLFDLVPAAQRKVVIFDDFTADTGAVYRDVLEFLGVPDDGRVDFPKVRVAQVHRFPRLSRLYFDPPSLLRVPVALIKRAMRRRRNGLLVTLREHSKVRASRPVLCTEFEHELRRYFTPDVERLSALLGRDLAHWTATPGDLHQAAGRFEPESSL